MAGSGANFHQDVERYVGDTYAEEFTLVDDDGKVIDITNRVFTLSVNALQNPTASDPDLYELTGVITDAEDGEYEFPLSASQATAAPGDYFYNIKMTFNPGSGNVVRTVGGGDWKIIQGI